MESMEVNLQDNTKTAKDEIRVLFSDKITDPQHTPIQQDPQKNDVRVLVIPDHGGQRLCIFTLPDAAVCTVQDLLVQLDDRIEEKIVLAYHVTDAVHNVNYVVLIHAKSNDDDKQIIKNIMTNQNNNSQDIRKNLTSIRKRENKVNKSRSFIVDRLKSFVRRKRILTYPLPPERGNIMISINDMKCLKKDEYLNDIIIDFYLKYLTLELLPDTDRKRTYVFSSYFYTRLSRFIPTKEFNEKKDKMSLAEIHHDDVKRWTKNVNLFEKDFIIIPINNNSHWLLVIICYPCLIGVDKTSDKTESVDRKIYPSIIIFDSMANLVVRRNSFVVNNLKNYLICEYNAKKMDDNALLDEDIEMIYPDVPRQTNSSDCGILLLQYAESFFKDFVVDRKPLTLMSCLSDWFSDDVIDAKRGQIQKLLIQLIVNSQER